MKELILEAKFDDDQVYYSHYPVIILSRKISTTLCVKEQVEKWKKGKTMSWKMKKE